MSTDSLSPEAIAQAKRENITGVKEQEFQLWRHSPITASYLQYLEDMVEYYRSAAADILEAGQFKDGDAHQDRNPDCLRGQIVMLRQLHGIELKTIHAFYGKEETEETQG